MGYVIFGLFFLICGFRLIVGDSGQMVATLPLNFGSYKNEAGLVLIFIGTLLFRVGVKSRPPSGQ